MTKEERYVKRLVKRKSFEKLKDSVKIGEICIYGVVVGFNGPMVAYAGVKEVKNGTLSEKNIYFVSVIEYLYRKKHNKCFYIGYKDDLKIAIMKNKLTDKYVRHLNTELSLETLESLKYSKVDFDDVIDFFIKLPWIILAVGPILGFIIMFCNIKIGGFVVLMSLLLFGLLILIIALADIFDEILTRLYWR